MKRRIDKKIHYKYLSDILLEFGLNSWTGLPAKQLSVGEKFIVDLRNIPRSFFKQYPRIKGSKLRYVLERITLADVPYKESCWWYATERTKIFTLYPEKYPHYRKYTAVDFPEK